MATVTLCRDVVERLAAIRLCPRYHAAEVWHPDCPGCAIIAALAPAPAAEPLCKKCGHAYLHHDGIDRSCTFGSCSCMGYKEVETAAINPGRFADIASSATATAGTVMIGAEPPRTNLVTAFEELREAAGPDAFQAAELPTPDAELLNDLTANHEAMGRTVSIYSRAAAEIARLKEECRNGAQAFEEEVTKLEADATAQAERMKELEDEGRRMLGDWTNVKARDRFSALIPPLAGAKE